MTQYIESCDALDPKTKDIVRALKSLREEIEAVDYYHQRVAACTDPELKGVMAHNRNEEIEHACMTIEWLRRNMDGWDKELRDYLFKDGSLVDLEHGD